MKTWDTPCSLARLEESITLIVLTAPAAISVDIAHQALAAYNVPGDRNVALPR